MSDIQAASDVLTMAGGAITILIGVIALVWTTCRYYHRESAAGGSRASIIRRTAGDVFDRFAGVSDSAETDSGHGPTQLAHLADAVVTEDDPAFARQLHVVEDVMQHIVADVISGEPFPSVVADVVRTVIADEQNS